MVKKSNRRGNSLVTNAPPTGRTTGASGGFDIVDGVAVPEDRSVRRFDGAELSSSLQGAYNAISNLFGGDASQTAFDQAAQVDLANQLSTEDPTNIPYLQNLLGLNVPIDGDYSKEEQDLVRQGIESGDFTVDQAADYFGIDPAIAQAAYDAPQVAPTPVTVLTEAELAQQDFDAAQTAFQAAVDDLNAWNQGQTPGSGRYAQVPINRDYREGASGAVSDDMLEGFFEGQRERQEALQVARANYEALGGNPDPFINQVLRGATTVGATPNVGAKVLGMPTFNQVLYNIPSIIAGQPTFTGQWSDSGVNTPIRIGQSGDTVIAGTTGIPALDEAINTATGGTVINADGTLNTPTIGSIGDAAREIVTSGGIGEIAAATGALNVTGDIDNESTEGVIGVGGYDFSSADAADNALDAITISGDVGSTVGPQLTTDAADNALDAITISGDVGSTVGPQLTTDAADNALDAITISGDVGSTVGPQLTTAPEIKFTPIDTETVTNRVAPTLGYKPGQRQEVTTTLNDALETILGSETTSSKTLNDAVEVLLGSETTSSKTLNDALETILAGESTYKTDAGGSLTGSLKGQAATSEGFGVGDLTGSLKGQAETSGGGEAGTLKGSLGGQTETSGGGEAGTLKGSLGGQTETSGGGEAGTLKGSLEGQTDKFSTYEGTLRGEAAPKLTTTLRGGGGGGGGGGVTPSGGTRTVSGGPGPLVDIDYLFDFAGGLDQPFLTTQEEEEALKRLNVYAEGGAVKKFDTVDTIINLLNARY